MPLYMDIHKNMKGMTAKDLAEAHKKDLAVQGKHGVKCRSYWHNTAEGKVFCLFDAPNKEAAVAVHREAHGALADEIFEVREGA